MASPVQMVSMCHVQAPHAMSYVPYQTVTPYKPMPLVCAAPHSHHVQAAHRGRVRVTTAPEPLGKVPMPVVAPAVVSRPAIVFTKSACASPALSSRPFGTLQAAQRLQYSLSPGPLPVVAAHDQKPKLIPVEVTTEPSLTLPLGPSDVQPWIGAARNFEMNRDFDVSRALHGRRLDLPGFMQLMKEESVGKLTIKALADKLVLHRVVQHLGIPQMPALLAVDGRDTSNVQRDIEELLQNNLSNTDSQDVVLKPTHLSNGKGVVIISPMKSWEFEATAEYLVKHVQQHLRERAGNHESVALRTLQPGFLAQPKYKSVVGFKTPLELRVVVLWGKVRLALWWWGRGSQPDEFPNRNVWLVRRPIRVGELSKEDDWELIHEHTGANLGFDRAVELFRSHISSIAAAAEALAVAVGAPFLRVDFFVGDPTWGLRLNEVAYGCGVDYRNRVPDDWEGKIVDDAPAIAHILQEGMAQCKRLSPARHFLSRLGVRGCSYETMTVEEPSSPRISSQLPDPFLGKDGDSLRREFGVPEELCTTIPGSARSSCKVRSRSFHAVHARTDDALPARASYAPRSSSFNSALYRFPSLLSGGATTGRRGEFR
eukprot:CAMPEP_0117491466 /NCGR_PEP_ID=MMETSP0784-20121206/18082_1 /TAXON_ID=39447 /ORGANISM="" /LENGTH=597 /DNA_ID=CAMNT_0005286259 /DNA_START=16 /DNA_END=1807 /DNA_ORIENTATION=+